MSSTPKVLTPSNLKGLLFLALGFMFFSAADIAAKYLTTSFHPVQIVWTRQAGLVGAALIIFVLKGPGLLRTQHPFMQLARGSVAIFSALFFVFAISYVPVADAVAVSFVAPFMVTILGVVFLKEKVGLHRWGAIIVGFIGALVIIRPGLGVFHPAIFLVVLAAAFFAVRQILSRPLAATDNTMTTLAYTAITSFALLSLPLPFFWQTPQSGETVMIMLVMAGLAALGETLLIRAFEFAEASVIAPMHYSLIIWASLFGWLVFGHLPDGWTWVGAAIIFATGLYLLYRERRAARLLRQQTSDFQSNEN